MTERTVSVGCDLALEGSVFTCGAAPVVVVKQWPTTGYAPGEPVTALRTHHIPVQNTWH